MEITSAEQGIYYSKCDMERLGLESRREVNPKTDVGTCDSIESVETSIRWPPSVAFSANSLGPLAPADGNSFDWYLPVRFNTDYSMI